MEKMELLRIGDMVRATMNGRDWYNGVYVEDCDFFPSFGVQCDDTGETRYFTFAEKLEE